MGTPRKLRYLAAGAAAGALALGSVGSAAAIVNPGSLLTGLTTTAGNAVGTVVPAATAPLVGQGGLLDNTNINADARIVVPKVAVVDTETNVAIDDGVITAKTDTYANVANVVVVDIDDAVVVVDTTRPSVFVSVPAAHVNVAGITADAHVAPTTVDLRTLTVDAPKIIAKVQAGDIKVKAKAKVYANLTSGKIKVKAKAKVKVGNHTVLKARAKVKAKLHANLKTKVKLRVIAH
jgi:hypothetical protein